jgi:hypothetical protein
MFRFQCLFVPFPAKISNSFGVSQRSNKKKKIISSFKQSWSQNYFNQQCTKILKCNQHHGSKFNKTLILFIIQDQTHFASDKTIFLQFMLKSALENILKPKYYARSCTGYLVWQTHWTNLTKVNRT